MKLIFMKTRVQTKIREYVGCLTNIGLPLVFERIVESTRDQAEF